MRREQREENREGLFREQRAESREQRVESREQEAETRDKSCLLYTSPSPRDVEESRMPSSA